MNLFCDIWKQMIVIKQNQSVVTYQINCQWFDNQLMWVNSLYSSVTIDWISLGCGQNKKVDDEHFSQFSDIL